MTIRNIAFAIAVMAIGVGAATLASPNYRSILASTFDLDVVDHTPTLKRAAVTSSAAASLSLLDESGNPLQLKDYQGKYTVLVFGCLT